MKANIYNFLRFPPCTGVRSDQKKNLLQDIQRYWEAIEGQIIPIFGHLHPSPESYMNNKYILKDISGFWEPIERQNLQLAAAPTLHWSPIWPKSTFLKSSKAIQKQMKANIYNFYGSHHSLGSDQTRKILLQDIQRFWGAIEGLIIPIFGHLHPSTESYMNNKYILKDISGFWEPFERQILQIIAAPTLQLSHIWPKSTIYKVFKDIEKLNAKFYNFLQPQHFTGVPSDQKVHF